ncbi:MAG: TRAP transporter fused permease subunit, partial [Clostridia bacterium]|nr:TRAP transporter fused permease subunit [Clostridia bacterium]
CIFGAFLSTFGVGDFMFKLSKKATNGLVASTAKTAIAFSTFMGMISGTAAGNVAVTGSLTIPMMNKSGYKRHESAAVEAVASTGGQIMPPIMGAAAFIMAEMTSTEYNVIMKSAIIPAILFFSSIYIIVHLISLRDNIDTGVNRDDEDSNILSLIKSDGYLLFPIITLILFMVTGYSPLKSALYSIGIMLILHLIVKREFSKTFLVKVYSAIVDGAKSTMLISIACGVSGIIVGVISITGVGSKLSSIIIDASGGNLFIALLLTMVTSIILGMGLPTTAAYLIPVSVIAPALVQMGVPLLTAHMFIFLFACVSTITPPVALASYVAAGISEANINKVGWTGFRFATASYILPFMLVYSPAIMLSGDILSNILAVISGFVTIYCIAVSIVGYFNKKLSNAFRIAMLVIGLAIVKNNMVSNIMSLIIFTVLTYSSLKNKGVKNE